MTAWAAVRIRHVVDSNILVYSLLKNHPAHQDCATYLANLDFENTLYSTLNSIDELYHVLLLYYQLTPDEILHNIRGIMESSIVFMHPGTGKEGACKIALENNLHLNDCELYFLALEVQAPVFVTEDVNLARFVQRQGLLWETPIQPSTRLEIARWEQMHAPAKGLPRILTQVYRYLDKRNGDVAREFKEATANLTSLPRP